MIFLNLLKNLFDFEEAVRNGDIIGILLFLIIIMGGIIIFLFKIIIKNYKKHQNDIKELQDIYTKKKEESEKEIIEVLNGVSTILKMSEQADRFQTDKILTSIKTLGEKIIDKLENLKK